MISKAVSVTKDYLRWAFGAMLVSAAVLFAAALAIQHLPIFISIVVAIIGAAIVYYFSTKDSRPTSYRLAHESLNRPPEKIKADLDLLPKRTQIIHQAKKTGFLGLRTEHKYWVVIYSYKYDNQPSPDNWFVDELRAAQSDFRACGVDHVYVDLSDRIHQKVVIACVFSHVDRDHFDPGICKNILSRIASTPALIVTGQKLIQGPFTELGTTMIGAF